MALHFTWHPDDAAVGAALDRLEPLLVPFAARPHWGKVSRTPSQRLPDLYPELGRWAVAVRTSAVVRAARSALVARVVHNDAWEQNVRAALDPAR